MAPTIACSSSAQRVRLIHQFRTTRSVGQDGRSPARFTRQIPLRDAIWPLPTSRSTRARESARSARSVARRFAKSPVPRARRGLISATPRAPNGHYGRKHSYYEPIAGQDQGRFFEGHARPRRCARLQCSPAIREPHRSLHHSRTGMQIYRSPLLQCFGAGQQIELAIEFRYRRNRPVYAKPSRARFRRDRSRSD